MKAIRKDFIFISFKIFPCVAMMSGPATDTYDQPEADRTGKNKEPVTSMKLGSWLTQSTLEATTALTSLFPGIYPLFHKLV